MMSVEQLTNTHAHTYKMNECTTYSSCIKIDGPVAYFIDRFVATFSYGFIRYELKSISTVRHLHFELHICICIHIHTEKVTQNQPHQPQVFFIFKVNSNFNEEPRILIQRKDGKLA